MNHYISILKLLNHKEKSLILKHLEEKNGYYYDCFQSKNTIIIDEILKGAVVYSNGNYLVLINLINGTKFRISENSKLIPTLFENIDIKITNYCEENCLFCHENSTINGLHAQNVIDFIQQIHSYRELAIGGGNVLKHPKLIEILEFGKKRNLIINITVNFHQINFELIDYLLKNQLIYGIGISLNELIFSQSLLKLKQKYHHRVVLHTIIGILNVNEIKKLSLIYENINILILGYKYYGRGKSFYHQKIKRKILQSENTILNLLKNTSSVISFDNLAIKQLKLKHQIDKKIFHSNYLGDDGSFSMYFDLVEYKYAKGSTFKRKDIINKNIYYLFKRIQNEKD